MRLRALLLLGWASAGAASQPDHQLALQDDVITPPTTISVEGNLSETLVSALSASDQHGTFIHLLQRAKLIPFLSHEVNGTVFAPTDAAWKAWEDAHRPPDGAARIAGWLGSRGLGEWLVKPSVAEQELAARIARAPDDEEDIRIEADNQNWALRQHLVYHILNYTLSPKEWAPQDSGNITVETTLLYPLDHEPKLPKVPEPGTPWHPGAADGMLGAHGQRLRLGLPGSEPGGQRGRVGFDHAREGGADVWDGAGWKTDDNPGHKVKGDSGVRWVRNGLVVGINAVLEQPPSMTDAIRKHPALTYLARLLDNGGPLPRPLPPWLDRAPHVTLFAASDTAYGTMFDDIDRGYLEGAYGSEGLGRVLAPSVLLGVTDKMPVGWRDAFGKKATTVASASDMLSIEAPKDGTLLVNGTEADTVDIFTANGVIHIMPKVILPDGFELLNSAEKVLLSRNATRFVSLMRSANLSSAYIGEPGKKTKDEWTILAPTDDAIEYMEWWAGRVPVQHHGPFETLLAGGIIRPHPPAADISPLAELLKYHIVPGRVVPGDIEDGMLLGTELRTAALGGGRQKVHVEMSERRKQRIDQDFEDGEIRFGGAMVLGSPVKSGKSVIYFISSLLSPPLDVLQTAVADLQLSTYIAAVYAAGLERSVRNNVATTYFIPRNKAFGQLGLAMKYLLLPEARDELRKVVRYHSVEKLIYTPDVEAGKYVYTTMEGGNIVLNRDEHPNFTLVSPSKWLGHDSGYSLPSNGDLRAAGMTHHNNLAETGVIHIIDSVVLPSDVVISPIKLVHGSKQRTMAELMVKAGLGFVLEGRSPTEEEVVRVGLQGHIRPLSNKTEPPPENPSDLAYPAYTVLLPTDKAFSSVNLTYYLEDSEALLELLKLHIIPSDLTTLPKGALEHQPRHPPADGTPLALEDDVVYPTLLSPSAPYGEVAFRAYGEVDWLVGVRNARGSGASARGARTGAAGRASVRWTKDQKRTIKDEDGTIDASPLWRGGMTLGGGVIVIDEVLVPYHPSWFERWGWLVLSIVGVVLLVSLGGGSVWWWWSTTRGKRDGYEPVATEDEQEREEANRRWRRTSRGAHHPADAEENDE